MRLPFRCWYKGHTNTYTYTERAHWDRIQYRHENVTSKQSERAYWERERDKQSDTKICNYKVSTQNPKYSLFRIISCIEHRKFLHVQSSTIIFIDYFHYHFKKSYSEKFNQFLWSINRDCKFPLIHHRLYNLKTKIHPFIQ